MSPHVSPLTLGDKLALVIAVVRAVGTAAYTFISSPFRGSAGAPTVALHVRLAALRALLENMTVLQSQKIAPSIQELYAALAQKKGFPPRTLVLPDGTEAFWFGNKNAKQLVVWIHGGGFCLPADPGHLSFMTEIVEAAGSNVALLLPSYELAPYARYPHQLIQAVEVLRHLVTELKYDPANIILGGDSAGANLSLGLLSHISHPHPLIPRLTLSAPLRGLLLFSPWTSYTMKPSAEKNKSKDIISPRLNEMWSRSYLGDTPRDNYNEPGIAEPEWWRGIKVEEILVVGSADEVLTDTIGEMAANLETVHPNTKTILIPGEYHDQPFIAMLGGGGQQAAATKSWIASRMK